MKLGPRFRNRGGSDCGLRIADCGTNSRRVHTRQKLRLEGGLGRGTRAASREPVPAPRDSTLLLRWVQARDFAIATSQSSPPCGRGLKRRYAWVAIGVVRASSPAAKRNSERSEHPLRTRQKLRLEGGLGHGTREAGREPVPDLLDSTLRLRWVQARDFAIALSQPSPPRSRGSTTQLGSLKPARYVLLVRICSLLCRHGLRSPLYMHAFLITQVIVRQVRSSTPFRRGRQLADHRFRRKNRGGDGGASLRRIRIGRIACRLRATCRPWS